MYCSKCKKAINQAWQLLFLEEKNPDMTPEECAEMIAYDKGWTCASRGDECPEDAPRFTTTIKKNDYGEWVVRLFRDGKWLGDKHSHHTEDKDDAYSTAKSMVERLEFLGDRAEL